MNLIHNIMVLKTIIFFMNIIIKALMRNYKKKNEDHKGLFFHITTRIFQITTRKSAKTNGITNENNFIYVSIGIYQQTIPVSDTDISSVITVENIDGMILSIKFLWEIYFFGVFRHL